MSKIQARGRVAHYKKLGILPELPDGTKCAFCLLKNATDYHHEDYSKFVDVLPVCTGCNTRRWYLRKLSLEEFVRIVRTKVRRPVKLVTTSFRMTPMSYRAFREKVPQHGDRSRLISKLVELFISGHIKIKDELIFDHVSCDYVNEVSK